MVIQPLNQAILRPLKSIRCKILCHHLSQAGNVVTIKNHEDAINKALKYYSEKRIHISDIKTRLDHDTIVTMIFYYT